MQRGMVVDGNPQELERTLSMLGHCDRVSLMAQPHHAHTQESELVYRGRGQSSVLS